MDLKAILKQLTEKGYVLSAGKGKYSFSMKFYDELKMQELAEKLVSTDEKPVAQLQALLLPNGMRVAVPLINGMTYSQLMLRFIQDAQIPQKVAPPHKEPYVVNKYNEKAAVRLYKLILEWGVVYDLIVKSTMLYYKGNNPYKKTIGNYIIDGDWKTDYEALKQSAQQGEEALKEHIKQEISNESGNYGYTLG
jgi:hypothetical protein